MFHNELQSQNRVEPLTLPPAPDDTDVQRKRMLIALGILLVALVGVVLKDWDFWFPPGSEVQEAVTRISHKSKNAAAVSTTTPAAPARERKPARSPAPAAPAVPFSAAAERAALPPLQVEVVAGNRHITVPGKSNAIHLDVNSGETSSATSAPAPASAPASGRTVNAGDRVQLSPQTAQSVSVSVPPDYPLLARQMKVQGSVILEAMIGRDGSIEDLHVLSGPPILAGAAQEAVKQWHFKPHFRGAEAVETQTKITVNFTISTN